MQNIYLIYIKIDRKWAICLHMEAQQYLGIQQTFVTTFSNHIDQWSTSGMCWIGIIIYHIQKIWNLPLTKDIPPSYTKIIIVQLNGGYNQRRSDKTYFTKSFFHTWSSTKWWDRRSKVYSSDNLVNLFTKDCQHQYLGSCDTRFECIVFEISSEIFIRGRKIRVVLFSLTMVLSQLNFSGTIFNEATFKAYWKICVHGFLN